MGYRMLFDLEKLKTSNWFKKDNLIVLVLVGVLLFIIALPTRDNKENAVKENQDTVQASEAGKKTIAGNESYVNGQDEYSAQLEARLEEILSGVDGVGKVKVMVTLASSEELVLEKDKPSSRSQTNETDSTGGTRVITQMENGEETVYITEGSSSSPYVVKTLVPKVEGVVVVAEGCGRGSIDKNVTEIVQALFGVEAHKVKVVKMGEVK